MIGVCKMPTFEFEAINFVGIELKDIINAKDSSDVDFKIRKLGYFPKKIKLRRATFLTANNFKKERNF